jgi:hypothetical protein
LARGPHLAESGAKSAPLPDEGTPVVNPLSAQTLLGIRFTVEGHAFRS